MTTPFKRSTLASVLALLATHASASGFQINEHSAAGLGRAFAGEGAIADSAAVLGRNPAAMMMFDKTAVSVAATMVDPDYSVDGALSLICRVAGLTPARRQVMATPAPTRSSPPPT